MLAEVVLLHLLQFVVGEVDDGAVAFLCPFDFWCIFVIGVAGVDAFAAGPFEEPLESGEVVVDGHALLVAGIYEVLVEAEEVVGIDEVKLGVVSEVRDEFSETHKGIHCALAPRLVVLAVGEELSVGGEECWGRWRLRSVFVGSGVFGCACKSLS